MMSEPCVDDIAGLVEIDRAAATASVVGRTFLLSGKGATRDLALFLYRVLHTRNTTSLSPVTGRSLRDPKLEARLVDATPHHTSRAIARRLPDNGDTGDQHVLLKLEGLRVYTPRATLSGAGTGGGTAEGDLVEAQIPSMRPAVSPGYFMVDSSLGPGGAGGSLLRLYISLADPDEASKVWHDLLVALEESRTPYRAKICSQPEQYPRSDAIVVYLSETSRGLTRVVTDRMAACGGLGGPLSQFASPIASGVAAAWEPRDPRPSFTGLSFGQHRSLLTAVAARDVATGATSAPLDVALKASFDEGGVSSASLACGTSDPLPRLLIRD